MNSNGIYIIAGILALIIIVFFAGVLISNKFTADDISGWLGKPPIVRDTVTNEVIVVVPSVPDTIEITKTRLKTVYRNEIDTFYIAKAFSKIVDTTIKDTKVYFEYCFPEDSLILSVIPKPDSTVYITKYQMQTIYMPVETEKQRPFWIDALTHIGATALGYGAGKIK